MQPSHNRIKRADLTNKHLNFHPEIFNSTLRGLKMGKLLGNLNNQKIGLYSPKMLAKVILCNNSIFIMFLIAKATELMTGRGSVLQ